MTRQCTNRLLDMIEDGLLDRDTVIMACLKYMSEDDGAESIEYRDKQEWLVA